MATKKPTKKKPAKPQRVSEALRQAIDESGLSLYEIAKRADVDYGALHRFARSGADVRVSTIDAVAATLGLELTPR